MIIQIKMIPAVIFYILYVVGLILFAISPALPAQNWLLAIALAAALGMAAYANYDFTFITALRDWTISLTLMDIVVALFVICVSATAGFYLAHNYMAN